MRSVVTGASGFIGRAVVAELLARGHLVTALVRDEPTVALLPTHPCFEIRSASIDSAESARRALGAAAYDYVFHLAGGRVADGAELHASNTRLNVLPTAALLDALADSPPRALVLASSGEVYGDQPGPFVESAAPRPITPYAVSKLAAEALVLGAASVAGYSAVAARLGVVYGPGQGDAPMLVPQVLKAAAAGRDFEMSSGEQTRDFVFITDVARALASLAERCPPGANVINVGTGVGVAVRDAARAALDAWGNGRLRAGALPPRPREIMDYRLDNKRLHDAIGETPQTTLADGLAQTVAALRTMASKSDITGR
ncbi:MAG: NAD-dependent epimerase/dehydratase family protein [Polyangiaceae bacterium]